MAVQDADCTNAVQTADDQVSRGLSFFDEKELERLGRERPAKFKSIWMEIGFGFALLASLMMAEYFTSGFQILLPTLAQDLNIPKASQTWPASVFSLVTGAFLLPFARVADLYGGYVVFMSGLVWFCIWSLAAGFSNNYITLIVFRALQGLGPAAFLPTGIMLVGSIYRPGPRKNLIFGLYGASAPFGFFTGIFFSGLCEQLLLWRWWFWLGAILLAVITVSAFWAIPSDSVEVRATAAKKNLRMDWLGMLTIVPGLLLVVFAVTYSAHASRGWATPYVPVTFVIGILFLCGAFYVEGWVVKEPMLPFDLFKVNGMKSLSLALFVLYGVFGIYLFYASMYIEEVLGKSALQTTAWYAPMAVGGLLLATLGGFILHLLPGTILLILSGVGYVMSMLLFAILPTNQPNYWAYVFPAMLCATLGIDVMYNVTNVFITTSMPRHRQGLAGGLINSLLYLGISFFLGIADIIVSSTEHRGVGQSYKIAFWFGVACAGFALLILVFFVRLGKAKSELTVEEKAELEAELLRNNSSVVS